MGAKVSSERAENSSAVKIVLAGGREETYHRPVSAQEVMLLHPRHVVTLPEVFRSDVEKALIPPEAVLMPGHRYYLLSYHTVKRLLNRQEERLKEHIIDAPIAGDAIKPAMASPYQQHRSSMVVTFTQSHPVRSSRESTRRRPGYRYGKGRAVKSPSRTSAGQSPSRACAGKSPSRSSAGKSPSRSGKYGEGSQRSRRISPKVFPGRKGFAVFDEEPNTSKSLFTEAATMKDEKLVLNQTAEDGYQPSCDQLKSMQAHQLLIEDEEAKPLPMRTSSKLDKEASQPRITLGYRLHKLSSSFSACEATDESEELFKEASVSPGLSTPVLYMPSSLEEKAYNQLHMVSSMKGHLADELFQKHKEGLTSKGPALHQFHRPLQEKKQDPSNMALSDLLKIPDPYEAILFQDMEEDSLNEALLDIFKLPKLPELQQDDMLPVDHQPSSDLLKMRPQTDMSHEEKEGSLTEAVPEKSEIPEIHQTDILEEEKARLLSEALSELLEPPHQAENQIKDTLLDVSVNDGIAPGEGLRTNLKLLKDVEVDDQDRDTQVCALVVINQEQELQPDNMSDNLPSIAQAHGGYQVESVLIEDQGQDFPVLPEVEVAELQTMDANAQESMGFCGSTEVHRDNMASSGLTVSESMGISGSVEFHNDELASCVLLDMETGKLQHVNQADNQGKQVPAWLSLDPVRIPTHPKQGFPSGLVLCGQNNKGKMEHFSKPRLYEDISPPRRVTLGDHFLHPSPQNPCVNVTAGNSFGMNQGFCSGIAPSSSVAKIGSSHTVPPDQRSLDQHVSNHARKQPNLSILGFHALRSDNPSLIDQLRLHKRAQGVATAPLHHDVVSVLDEIEVSSRLRQQQQRGHQSKEKLRTLLPASPQPKTTQRLCPSPSRPSMRRVRIRSLQYRQTWKPMSPIIETSPEVTPFSTTPPLGTPQSSILHRKVEEVAL